MNRNHLCAIIGPIALLSAAQTALAQYDLPWHTNDGGGAMFITGPGWELSGTIGQPDAGGPMSGGAFEVTGGFWVVGAPAGCPEDLNIDGVIDLADLSILLTHFGQPGGPSEGDINGDGNVDLSDLSLLLTLFGTSC